MIRNFWHRLPRIAILSLLLALVTSLASASRFLTEGYPLLALEVFRNHATLALAVGGTFLLLREGALALFAGRLAPRLGRGLATAMAMVPWVAYFGYRLNLSRGIRPSQLLDAYALEVNLFYLLGCGLLFGFLLILRSRPEPERKNGIGWLAGLAAFLLALHGGLAMAFGPRDEPHPRPNVLILLIDTLRADHLGVYGYDRDTSPALDALAADSVLFRHAIAQSTFTKSSIASLFTGRNVYQHGVYWGSHRETPDSIKSDLLSLEEETLAERLRAADYYTTAWVQNSHLRGFMGFSQGFVSYHDQQGSIERIHRKFRHWLRNGAQRYQWLTYLHYIDLHDPYRPEAPYDSMFGSFTDVYENIDLANWGTYLQAVRDGEVVPTELEIEQYRALYDGLIRKIDDEIGTVLEELKARGLYDEALIIVTSDHGDGFMEHGFISHSTTPYDELIRVPLIVKLPGNQHRGQVVEQQVRLIDIVPTVMEVVKIRADRELPGCGLLQLMASPETPRPPGCGYAVSEIAESGAYPSVAVRSAEKKLIHFENKDDELYDLLADPGERTPRSPVDEEDLRLETIAQQVLVERSLQDREQVELDERQIQELKALGYID